MHNIPLNFHVTINGPDNLLVWIIVCALIAGVIIRTIIIRISGFLMNNINTLYSFVQMPSIRRESKTNAPIRSMSSKDRDTFNRILKLDILSVSLFLIAIVAIAGIIHRHLSMPQTNVLFKLLCCLPVVVWVFAYLEYNLTKWKIDRTAGLRRHDGHFLAKALIICSFFKWAILVIVVTGMMVAVFLVRFS